MKIFFVFALITFGGLNVSAQCGQPLPGRFSVGANLNALADYDYDWPFNDVFKTARRFSTNTTAPYTYVAPVVDMDGWPIQDFGSVVMSGMDTTMAGTYKLRFLGQAAINIIGNNYTVSNQIYDTLTNTTNADITFTPAQLRNSTSFMISFTNTIYDANTAGVKKVQIMKPGRTFNGPVFDSTFTAHLSRFDCIRFMTWLQSIGSIDTLWSKRVLTTYATQHGGAGAAWEYCIQLSNQLHADFWGNVPYRADSNYIANLAQLLKDSLDPTLHIYMEHSNEVWNWGYPEATYNKSMATYDAAQPGSLLNYDSVNDPNTWAMRRHALRCKQISDIFKNVFGSAELNNRVRVLYGAQLGFFDFSRRGLDFINDVYGKPSNYFYAVCAAPYFNLNGLDTLTNLTSTDVLNGLQASINGKLYPPYKNQMDVWAARTHFYGLHLIAYEAGPDTYGPNNVAAKAAASRTQRMKDICYNFTVDWFNYGFDGVFNWYAAGAGNWLTNYGTWSLTERFENSEKLQAIDSFRRLAAYEPTAGLAIPGSVDARKPAGYDSTSLLTTSYTVKTYKKMEEWLLRVPLDSAGDYSLGISTSVSSSGIACVVVLDDTILDTLTVPNSGSAFDTTMHGTHFMSEGFHTLRLRYLGNSFKLRDLIFSKLSGCTNTATEIEVLPLTEKVRVYPNPFSDNMQFIVPSEFIGKEAVLMDINGRVLQRMKTNYSDNELSTVGLSSGVYLLQIGNTTTKLVKN